MPRKKQHTSAFNVYYNTYKTRARLRGKVFELSKEQFKEITSSSCSYCGAEPAITKSAKKFPNGKYPRVGIDRIDNSIGYTIGNSTPCCMTCNMAKGELTTEEFIAWIKRLHNYLIQGKD